MAGESEAGDGGNEVGESGCETRPFVQVCCGEVENGRDPLKLVGHGDEGGSA